MKIEELGRDQMKSQSEARRNVDSLMAKNNLLEQELKMEKRNRDLERSRKNIRATLEQAEMQETSDTDGEY